MRDEQAAARLGRIVGKYTLERVLGSGGMSTVYAASHRNGNRVAVKMLKPAYAITSEVRARFSREGYAANRVRHPGAVRVLDDDVTDDGLVFLVMELLEGSTLDALAKESGGKLSLSLALAVGKQLLQVLEAAHAAGIVHRDIKPENVFIQSNGKLKVLDFGIARILSARDGTVTTTGRMLGTPAFMPPEQAYGRRDEVDAQSDLWSVGATLFATMTGRVVHHADTAEETLIKAATEPAPSLATMLDDVSPSVVALVDRSLQADKGARFASAAEMLAALERAHHDAFGDAVPPMVLHGPAGPSADDVTDVPLLRRALGFAAWAAPIALVLALVLSGTSVRGEPSHAVTSDTSAAITANVAPVASASESDVAPARAQEAEPDAPNEITALEHGKNRVGVARAAVARAASVATAAPVAPPAAAATATTTTTATTRGCGFELDEEGRKWPRRCP